MRTDLYPAEVRSLDETEMHAFQDLSEPEARELDGGGRLRVPVGYTLTGDPIYEEE